MKLNILRAFGLAKISTLNEVEKRNREYLKLISDLTKAVAEYEKMPEPTVEFKNYKPELNVDGVFNQDLFDEWYSLYRRNQYEAFKMIKLCKHPHLLNAFMNEFGSFDWESVRSYMEETNWFWSKNLTSPTIEQLKDCVITLIPEDNFDWVGNAISSAGFTVELYYNECEPVCKISFDKRNK
jgi:hypothetical protein